MSALVLATSLSFVFFLLALVPAGALIVRRFFPDARPMTLIAFGLPCSALAILAFVSAARLLEFPLEVQAWLLRIISFCALARFFAIGGLQVLKDRDALAGLTFWFLACLVATFSAAFPGARITDIHPHTIERLTGLATDNLISYNVARIFTENIPFFSSILA